MTNFVCFVYVEGQGEERVEASQQDEESCDEVVDGRGAGVRGQGDGNDVDYGRKCSTDVLRIKIIIITSTAYIYKGKTCPYIIL